MSGNVWEWTWDWYQSDYQAASSVDPLGAGDGAYRVSRGGSWFNFPPFTRLAARSGDSPDDSYHGLGLRIARSAAAKAPKGG